MRFKKRYVLVFVDGFDDVDGFSKAVFSVLDRFDQFLAIRARVKVIPELTVKTKNGLLGVISVSNEQVQHVIFLLSMFSKFYKANLLTIRNSGNLKRIKLEEKTYGTTG